MRSFRRIGAQDELRNRKINHICIMDPYTGPTYNWIYKNYITSESNVLAYFLNYSDENMQGLLTSTVSSSNTNS